MGTLAGDHPGGGALSSGMASPTLSRMVLGWRLRRHREAGGLSREDAGQAIRASHAKISRLELGRAGVQLRDVIDLCELYGVRDHTERTALLGLAREANVTGWWAPYSGVIPPWFELFLGLEQAAHIIRTYEVQFVPGLLQIPGYACGVIGLGHGDAPDADLELRLELRMRRQQILYRRDPPHLWVVIDEAALRRQIGGRATMFRQLQYLIDACDRPRVTVQVLPFEAGGHAAGGAVTLLRLPEQELPDVIYLEQLITAIYLDTPHEVEFYRHVLNLLVTRDAAPPVQTPSILQQIIRDL